MTGVVERIVTMLLARANSLESSGNQLASYEARNCALAVERLFGEQREAAFPDGSLVDVVAERLHVLDGLEFGEGFDLELTDALPGEVHDGADVLERGSAAVGDIEGAALVHLPNLEVGEVELDGAGA